MSDIDFDTLLYSIMENIDDTLIDGYDFDIILQSAESCWDDTAILVKSVDFEFGRSIPPFSIFLKFSNSIRFKFSSFPI